MNIQLTLEELREGADAMLAAADGEAVQLKHRDANVWHDAGNPTFDFSACNYRRKPKPRVFWINDYGEENRRQQCVYETQDLAKRGSMAGASQIKLIEVID